ncbi:MAG: MBL fold metallo-hydrolase [Actinomycetota bacterium]|nr:MBL fold metallo-hydrolase [Actinomycetota bacterium]
MRVLFCGVRGSTPSPGADYVRYGGNTSCVALSHGDELPSLVLDAGTGLQSLSRRLGADPFRGTILLGHLHWDHTHGLPFFAAGDRPDSEVELVMPAQGDLFEVLERAFSPPHFPITPRQFRGQWVFSGLEPGQHRFEGFDVTAREIPHKGGRTFGYRICDGAATIAYLSDHGPVAGKTSDAVMDLTRDVDLLIHDSQYTAAEFPARQGFGHATVEYAVELAAESGARTLALFHHDPARTDDEVDAIVAGLTGAPVEVIGAAEGLTVDL